MASTLPLRICTVLLVLPVLTFTLVARQQSSYSFDQCSQDQQNKINGYLDDMQELASAAMGPSESTNAGNDWYKAWWGPYDANALQYEKINSRYEKLSVWKTDKGLSRTISCNVKANCCSAGMYPSSAVACVARGGDDTVALCTTFWLQQNDRLGKMGKPLAPTNIMLDKWRTRGSILLHELTHALFNTADQVWYPSGEFKRAYGHQNCLEYSLNNTNGARRNADHYEYFATAAYYGNGNVAQFATDPGQVRDSSPIY